MFRFLMSDGRGGVRIVNLPRWALWAAGAGVFALVLLFLAFSLTLLLALTPVAIAAGLIGRWRMRRALREGTIASAAPVARDANPAIIDVDYRIIDHGPPR